MIHVPRRTALRALSVLLVTMLAFMAAPLDMASAQDKPESLPTIAEAAVATPELSALVSVLTFASKAGPVDFLSLASDPDADLTVFAPTNDAFEALGQDTLNAVLADPTGLLTDILSYHVLGTSQSAEQLLAAGQATTLQGDNVTITIDDTGNVFINNSQVVIADIEAINGTIHVINTVLLPPADPEPLPTIADIAIATPELSTLVTALTVATDAGGFDFIGAASNPDADLTVFAPTNDAFEALGQDTLNAVLADPTGLLTDILSYHVLGTSQSAEQLLAAGQATTLQGDNVTITIDDTGNVFINNSQVVIADIEAINGTIHVINTVLLPPADPEPTPVVDGARIYIISSVSGRYLDGDRGWWGTNVDTSKNPRLDDEWILEETGNGTFYLENAQRHRYLDADNRRRHYNVDLARKGAFGTEWDITLLDNGNYLLRTVDFNRFLDYDRYNVDTSATARADDEWQIVLVPGH